MLPPPRAVAFDLDGTLIDSVEDIAASANHVRVLQGLPSASVDLVRTYVGDGARRLVQRTLELVDDANEAIDEGLQIFRAHYREHCLDRTRPYPQVRETLQALRPLPMAVVTNKPQTFADIILEGLGLASFFGAVVGARPGIPVKPAPDLVHIAFDQLGVDSTQGWMVGDSHTDMVGGRAAGCTVVLVTYGLGDPDRLRALEPDAVIGSFAELLALVRR